MTILKKDLRSGDIIQINGHLKVVVLYVSKYKLKHGMNADKPGYYGFYGMWYGTDILDANSFGKIHYIARGTITKQYYMRSKKRIIKEMINCPKYKE